MAVNATAIWRVRPSGSNTNGGGYDPGISGAATDYSQQNSAQATGTHGVTTGTTTFTDATAAAFTSAMVGNAMYITGSGQTTGFYFVTAFTSSSIVTLDRSPGTGTGATWNLGGGWATIANLESGSPLVNYNLVYWLGSGTPNPSSYTLDYTISSTSTLASVIQTWANDPQTPGYKAWPDTTGGMPVIEQNASSDGIVSKTWLTVQGLWFVMGSAATNSDAIGYDGPLTLQGCVFDQANVDTYLVFDDGGQYLTAVGCEFFSSVSGSAISTEGVYNNSGACFISGCNIHDLTSNGLLLTNPYGAFVESCIIAKCLGTTYAIQVNGLSRLATVKNCTIDDNAGSAILLGGTPEGGAYGLNLINNIISNHTGAGTYGIDNSTPWANSFLLVIDYNIFYNNTSNYNGISAGPHDTALGTNPYNGQSTEDYSLK